MRLAPITLLLLAIIALAAAMPVHPASGEDDDTPTSADHVNAIDDREAEIKKLQAMPDDPSVRAKIKALEIERDHHLQALDEFAKKKAVKTIPDPFSPLPSHKDPKSHHDHAIEWHRNRAERARHDVEKEKKRLDSPEEGTRKSARIMVALATAEANQHDAHVVSHTESRAKLGSPSPSPHSGVTPSSSPSRLTSSLSLPTRHRGGEVQTQPGESSSSGRKRTSTSSPSRDEGGGKKRKK